MTAFSGFLAKITAVSPISAVRLQPAQNLRCQAHMIQNTRVMTVLWKAIQVFTMEVMGVAFNVVGIADVDFSYWLEITTVKVCVKLHIPYTAVSLT